MNRYYWTAICFDERNKSISKISSIIDKYAIIINFQRFSDVSIGLTIEIDEDKIRVLYAQLQNILKIEGYESPETIVKDSYISLNIIFTKGSGDLEIEVPAISE